MDARLEIRIDKQTLRDWRKRAAAAGLPLSAWIRLTCNGLTVQPAGPRPESQR